MNSFDIEMSVNLEIFAGMIDFRKKRGSTDVSLVTLIGHPTKVLYKDGVFRDTTQAEINRQLIEMRA